eukprot:gnl/TRDRNA2_/TRDRNA2_176455_c0_seq1.p1 gnl/TRDRNA2_/TRDRNA2_176455_c0~~gnl/TRDRNA2_/TRDRNA2_176455_c0_seq1.p1  ORF type:complete len:222 (+),score=47.31 gnl/TRDRNA2_/TRDRNA2_176455_c0_seq1:110-775(+)
MMLGETMPRKSYCDGKVFLLLSLLFGCAALLSLQQTLNNNDATATMISVSSPTRSSQPLRASQSMPFMGRVPAQRPSQAVSALKSPSQFDDSTYELSGTESQMQGRREAIAQAVAALGVAAAVTQNQPALAEDAAAKPPSVAGRLGSLIVLPGIAVSWVLFNILGPATNQLDGMSAKADAREGKKPFTMPKASSRPPPKFKTTAKAAPAKTAAKKSGGFFR